MGKGVTTCIFQEKKNKIAYFLLKLHQIKTNLYTTPD